MDMTFISKLKNKSVSGQTREVLTTMLHYLKGLASKYYEMKEIQQVQKFAVTATGLVFNNSTNNSKNRKGSARNQSSFTSPTKKNEAFTKNQFECFQSSGFKKLYRKSLHY